MTTAILNIFVANYDHCDIEHCVANSDHYDIDHYCGNYDIECYHSCYNIEPGYGKTWPSEIRCEFL